jgi:hypothetical protein
MARRSDTFGQYTADDPVITQGDYSWQAPQHPYAHQPPAARIAFGGGAPSGGGGGRALSEHQKNRMTGDEFQRRWAQSEERVWRNQQRLNGSQPWTASPQDYEDVLGPERSGGLDKIVSNGNANTGLRKNEGWGEGTAGVPATSNGGNGDGLSGGAARPIPTGVSF